MNKDTVQFAIDQVKQLLVTVTNRKLMLRNGKEAAAIRGDYVDAGSQDMMMLGLTMAETQLRDKLRELERML